jgi:hypothetical protein
MWDNFEEMEEKLSMPELTAILTATREKIEREQRFAAALQGVDLSGDPNAKSFNDIMVENMGSGDIEKTGIENDVIQLNGAAAAQAGFGVGLGLGYHIVDA